MAYALDIWAPVDGTPAVISKAESSSSESAAQKAVVGERFDRAAFLAAAQELSAEQSADRIAVAEEIANAMEKLSPEDRKRLSEMRSDHGFGGGIFRYLPGTIFPGPRR